MFSTALKLWTTDWMVIFLRGVLVLASIVRKTDARIAEGRAMIAQWETKRVELVPAAMAMGRRVGLVTFLCGMVMVFTLGLLFPQPNNIRFLSAPVVFIGMAILLFNINPEDI
jgi:hypothetical protein